jgi:hypothetical protein
MSLMGERAFVSRNTVARVEKGDPTVSLGIYATVLSCSACRTAWGIWQTRRPIASA